MTELCRFQNARSNDKNFQQLDFRTILCSNERRATFCETE